MMQPLLGARYQGVRPEGVRATRARAAGCGRLAGVVPRNRRSGPGGRQVFGIGLQPPSPAMTRGVVLPTSRHFSANGVKPGDGHDDVRWAMRTFAGHGDVGSAMAMLARP